MEKKKEPKTVLSAINAIIKAALYERVDRFDSLDGFFKFDEELLTKVKKDSEYLAEQFSISCKQSVLFSIIIEISKGNEFTKKDLAYHLKTNFVELLSYDEDLRALEAALLIRRCHWGRIRVAEDVQRCIEKNKPFKRPPMNNLSTFTILSRMTRLFRGMNNNEVDRDMALNEMDGMILANPETSIAKAADKYGILKDEATGNDYYDEDDGWMANDLHGCMCRAERMLFYALCFRYQEYEDDECGWWDFREFFNENIMDDLQTYYKDEILSLQENKVLVYSTRDGMIVKDRFKIDDKVKEVILADCGGLHDNSGMHGLLKSEELQEKNLFYDEPVRKSVDTLKDLLSDERYAEVRDALEQQGLRSGFTCLFYGSPGTGKTETVYQLAKQTGRDIIMADVSKLKSMWVGESEKNLKTLFSNYKKLVHNSAVTPILLFNEADAIFGIRQLGAEKAIDKMENSLQNIILQEMEDLKGILIATTNLTENLDKAFERRFLYKVKFNNPSVDIKCKIWKAMMPELSDVDAHFLAKKFDFSGGQIENVVRKKAIQTILTGHNPGIEDLMNFCCEEMMGARSQQR